MLNIIAGVNNKNNLKGKTSVKLNPRNNRKYEFSVDNHSRMMTIIYLNIKCNAMELLMTAFCGY